VCAPDCDANGTPDTCELTALEADCNANQTLDVCEREAGFTVTCVDTSPEPSPMDAGPQAAPQSGCAVAGPPRLDGAGWWWLALAVCWRRPARRGANALPDRDGGTTPATTRSGKLARQS